MKLSENFTSVFVWKSEETLLATLFQKNRRFVNNELFKSIHPDLFEDETMKNAWIRGKAYCDAYNSLTIDALQEGKMNADRGAFCKMSEELRNIVTDDEVYKTLTNVALLNILGKDVKNAVDYLKEYWMTLRRQEILSDFRFDADDETEGQEKIFSHMREVIRVYDEINNGSERFDGYLENNLEEILTQCRKPVADIPTQYVFHHRESKNKPIRFSLPSGALTVVGAATNHGKSKFLQSLALDVVECTDKNVLYCTYEEGLRDVYTQFLNSYINFDLSANNRKTLKSYLYDGSTKYFSEEMKKCDDMLKFRFLEDKFNNRVYSKRLIVVEPQDNYSSTLVGIIHAAIKKKNVGCIFVDYVQMLLQKDSKTKARTDQICEILIELEGLAKQYDVPIVLAAQLRRESSDSPLSMGNQSFADSDWIGRKPNTVLLLWSSQKTCFNDADGKKAKAVERELPELELGTNGKMYVKVTKSREIATGIECIIPINGNTGRIEGNLTDNLMDEDERLFIQEGNRVMESEYDNFVEHQKSSKL